MAADGQSVLDRMVMAVEKVRQRLLRAVRALEAAGVPYAVADGNAVAAWVASVDAAAVRNTQDVDVLLRRSDLPAAKAALQTAGFVHRYDASVDVFLDGEGAKARDAVHVVFAGERVREDYVEAAPDVGDSSPFEHFRVLSLDALVKMKLTSFRLKDRVHLMDMIDVGLIDVSWKPKLSFELASRLQSLIDNPEGY